MAEKKDSMIRLVGWILAALALFGILIIVILILFQEKRTEVTTTSTEVGYNSINCSINTFDEAFFIIDGASQVKHNVKALFQSDNITKLFYSYEGKLRSDEDARKAATSMNIKYDKYLGNHNYSSSKNVEETFSHDGNTVRINIYTDVEGINSDTASFFFLEKDKLNDLMRMNAEQLKEYYNKKGFVCDYQK